MSHAERTGSELLERHEELVRIESALARGREGTGSFVVIEGPAGIGKTAVLAAARASAEAQGMHVLRSRGAELEREFAFGVVRQLFEPPLAEAPAVERMGFLHGAAGLSAGVLGLPGADAGGRGMTVGPEAPFAVLHGLYWLCANLASARPVCLAWTMRIGLIPRRSASWRSCYRDSRVCARRLSWQPVRVSRARMPASSQR